MSKKKANTTAIGAFIIGAFIVTLSFLIFFGSSNFFTRNERFVVYFDESVNGLSVGNAVKFRGVRIGRVADIRIRYNQIDGSRHIPIFIDIDNQALLRKNDLSVDFSDSAVVDLMVERGLRARIQLESFVTGVAYVELDFSGRLGDEPDYIQKEKRYVEIPTVQSPLAAIGKSANEIFASLGTIDFHGLSTNLSELIERLNHSAGELDIKSINDALVNVATAVERMVGSGEIESTLVSLRGTLDEYSVLAGTVRERISPVLENVQYLSHDAKTSLETLNKTLESFDRMAQTVEQLVGPGSSLSTDARTTLEEFARTMRSLRELLQFVEQNPNAIFFGRQPRP